MNLSEIIDSGPTRLLSMAWDGALPPPLLTSLSSTSRRANGTIFLTATRRYADTFFLRYRFRLISLSCDPNYVFSIDGHDLTVIEADGIETQPVTVNAVQIFSAQRYSFVVSVPCLCV